MKDLIEALTIFAKYKDLPYPTNCSHDVLAIMGITKKEISSEDVSRLHVLGFLWDIDEGYWYSYKYGSA